MARIRVTAMRGSRHYDGPDVIATIEVPDDVADVVVETFTEAIDTARDIASVHGPYSGGVCAYVVE